MECVGDEGRESDWFTYKFVQKTRNSPCERLIYWPLTVSLHYPIAEKPSYSFELVLNFIVKIIWTLDSETPHSWQPTGFHSNSSIDVTSPRDRYSAKYQASLHNDIFSKSNSFLISPFSCSKSHQLGFLQVLAVIDVFLLHYRNWNTGLDL